MIYLFFGGLSFFGAVILAAFLTAKRDVKKEMDMAKFWERQDFADRVINECFKIESE